jgi:D-alanyl-D-alanine carboxypeptidase (penicillin-binding protein 5/6)
VTKRSVFLFVFVLVTLGLISYLLIKKGPIILISPLILGRDQTEKISQKISTDFNLNFGKSKELSTLETVPRYMVYNQDTGIVYYSKGTNLKMSPASFTKLLSAQIALDFVSTESSITVSDKSIDKVPTILGLKAGERLTVDDLLRGAIATSANDAAQVLADGVSESISIFPIEFIYYMNVKAELLGMKQSHFVNSDGLDDQNQYSTLEDITRLVNNVQKNYPDILAAAKSDNQDIEKNENHDRYYLPNWNGLLGVYPGVDGLKIAYTGDAGYSTIVTAKRNGFSMVALVSGTDSYLERDRAAADLLDAAFLAEGLVPVNITTGELNRHYKVWGDLARKIQAELKLLETDR